MNSKQFKKKIWDFYKKHKRAMPWRETQDPYHIFVSEVMLQQTQVGRVLEKYPEFLAAFPSVRALAQAPLKKILAVWQGMGYNRRALYLKQSAECIAREYNGKIPRTPEELESLPGIGPATARSIAAFAFNAPVAFIETNIRSVFIHEYYPGHSQVRDKKILPLVEQTVDKENAREWYYALMDYGAHLKTRGVNPGRRSTHHAKQKAFKGSNRELRGKMLRAFLKKPSFTPQTLHKVLGAPRADIEKNLRAFLREGVLAVRGGRFVLS